jgi:hypothetical protein
MARAGPDRSLVGRNQHSLKGSLCLAFRSSSRLQVTNSGIAGRLCPTVSLLRRREPPACVGQRCYLSLQRKGIQQDTFTSTRKSVAAYARRPLRSYDAQTRAMAGERLKLRGQVDVSHVNHPAGGAFLQNFCGHSSSKHRPLARDQFMNTNRKQRTRQISAAVLDSEVSWNPPLPFLRRL